MKRMLGLLLALLLLAVPFGASGEVTLPLTTEPVTLSLWLVANDTVSSLTDDYEKLPFFVEMESAPVSILILKWFLLRPRHRHST